MTVLGDDDHWRFPPTTHWGRADQPPPLCTRPHGQPAMPRPPRRPRAPAYRRGQRGAPHRKADAAPARQGSPVVAATGRPSFPPRRHLHALRRTGSQNRAHRVQDPAARPGERCWRHRGRPQREERGGPKEARQRHGHGDACRCEKDGGTARVCPKRRQPAWRAAPRLLIHATRECNVAKYGCKPP